MSFSALRLARPRTDPSATSHVQRTSDGAGAGIQTPASEGATDHALDPVDERAPAQPPASRSPAGPISLRLLPFGLQNAAPLTISTAIPLACGLVLPLIGVISLPVSAASTIMMIVGLLLPAALLTDLLGGPVRRWLDSRWALVFAVSMAVWFLLSALLLTFGIWSSSAVAAWTATCVAVRLLLWARSTVGGDSTIVSATAGWATAGPDDPDPDSWRHEGGGGTTGGHRRRHPSLTIHIQLLVVSLQFFVLTAFRLDPLHMGDFGLLPLLPIVFVLSIIFATVGFVLELSADEPRAGLLTIYVGLLVLILYGLAPTIYELPRYAWTYKYTAVVNSISATGHIRRSVDIYNNWPGLFGAVAALTKALHIDVTRVAAWAELMVAAMQAMAVGYLARGITDRAHVIYGAVWLFLVTNWVGQNYFAPQPFAFILVIVMAGVATRHLSSPRGLSARALVAAALHRLRRILRRPASALGKTTSVGVPSVATIRSDRVRAVATVLLLYAAVVVTHQLSPFMAIAMLAALTLLANLRPVWLVGVMILLVAGWFLLARDFLLAHPELIGLTSDVRNNAAGVQSLVPEPAASLLIGSFARALSLVVWAGGTVSALMAAWKRQTDRRVVALAFAPFIALLGGGYGGELIYRVFLFTLPAMSILCAGLLFARSASWSRKIVGIIVCCALTCGFMVAYFGRDTVNEMHAGEPELAAWVNDNAAPGSLIALAFPNFPWPQQGDYTRFRAAPGDLSQMPPRRADLPGYTPSELCDLAYGLDQAVAGGTAFMIVSDSQVAYARARGYAPGLTVEELADAMTTCGYYHERFGNNAGVVFQIIVPEAARAASGPGAGGPS